MKKGLKISLIVILVIIAFIVIDTMQAVIFKHSPLISWKQELEESGSYIDRGIIIDTYYCTKEQDIVTIHIESKFSKFSCPVDNIGTIINDNENNERIIMIGNKLYYDTGKESTVGPRCGVMDGYISSSVEPNKIPKINDQSNFGTGYGYQYIMDTIEVKIDGKFIVFEPRDKFYEIFKIDEDTTIYSTFSNPKYLDTKGNKTPLKEVLENKEITIDDIISDMIMYEAANDGGSAFYKSEDEKIYLAKCNSLPGNGGIKDIFISDDKSEILNYCTK